MSASIDGTLRDASGQQLPAGQGSARPPSGPPPPQAQPEQALGWSDASIRASEYAELVAKCGNLQEEIAARGESRPECGDNPEGVTPIPYAE